MAGRFFIVGINVCKKCSFQKTFPNSSYLRKKTLKSRTVLLKLCKENNRVQSKILDVFFSIEFRFETKIGCFVTRLYTFAHSYSSKYFLNLQWHLSIVGRTTHSHIQRYFCHKHDAHERIRLSILFCQYYCNSFSFLLSFIFIIFINRSNNSFVCFYRFLMQIRHILQWTMVSTVRYRKSDNWMMETVYSEPKVGNLL